MRPLIVTLALSEPDQARFDALRAAHFPRGLDHLQAHVTLFHALPGEHEAQVRADLAELADRETHAVRVTRVRSLGRGVAYDLQSDELDVTHRALAARWQPWLTRQDGQRLCAHVTVQNKVTAERARLLLERLQRDFVPYDVQATGLALWRYLGGPWEALEVRAFRP